MDDLPSDALEIEIGKDDEPYYTFRYIIEVTYQSGSTKYELLYKGEQQILPTWKAGNLDRVLSIGRKACDIVQ
jgi:hypothetical protein